MNVLEKILEEIESLHNKILKDRFAEQVTEQEIDSLIKVKEIIRSNMDEMNNDDWIPVEDRLPDEKINPITKDFYVYPVAFESGGVRDIRYYPFWNGALVESDRNNGRVC